MRVCGGGQGATVGLQRVTAGVTTRRIVNWKLVRFAQNGNDGMAPFGQDRIWWQANLFFLIYGVSIHEFKEIYGVAVHKF